MLVAGAMVQVAALSGPALIIVANAVGVAPISTERLVGNTAATKVRLPGVLATKLAVTVVAASSVSTQPSMPLHPPPDQPANVELAAAAAVKVICVPVSKLAAQVGPQLIPDGLLVTVPDPPPVRATDSILVLWLSLNVAFTLSAALIVTTHVPVPLHPPPDQPEKLDPELAEAVRVTGEFIGNGAAHLLLLALQLIPAGLLVTRPAPVPASVTVKVAFVSVKIAVTPWAAVIATVQVPVPVHPAPLHPAKIEPTAAGVAVNTTCVPD
jgi:hypothetical protein